MIPNVTERRQLPPEVGVSVVILALGKPSSDKTAGGLLPGGTASGGATGNSPEEATSRDKTLWIPLVRRIRRPHLGQWALPGSDLIQGLSLEQVAQKTLMSTTHLNLQYLEQLYTFGDPNRSSGGLPMVSIVYWSLVGLVEVQELTPVHNVQWFPVSDLPTLAFDHRTIIDYALERLRMRIDSPDIMTRFLGSTFTLRQLHAVCEAVAGKAIDLANFRRKMLASGTLEKTGKTVQQGSHRPAALYRYRPKLRACENTSRGLSKSTTGAPSGQNPQPPPEKTP